MKDDLGNTANIYKCIMCGALHDEQGVGSCRIEGFFRLYCPVAGCRGDVKLFTEGDNQNEL